MLLAFAATVCVLSMDRARADEPKDAKGAQAAKDPNYRWYNGQWWYWIAKDKNWLVWNGSQWTKFDQARANRGVRSFSYQEGNQGGYGTSQMFGTPLSGDGFPDMSNTQIIGSYGFRSAGSKALGHY
jgi:hypothetical protein